MSNNNPERPRLTEEQSEAFLTLLSEHEKALSRYVMGLVSSVHDVEDILQDGKIIMWRHFHKFELGTNFLAWGRKIMLHQIFDYRKRAKKQKRSQFFDENILEILESELATPARDRDISKREEALAHCMRLIPKNQRLLMNMRYQKELSIEQISHRLNRTDSAVYQLLYRIRKTLLTCVKRRLA